MVTLVGVIAPQVKFAGTVSVRLTVPVKPLTAATVIVEVAETPALTAAGAVAAIVIPASPIPHFQARVPHFDPMFGAGLTVVRPRCNVYTYLNDEGLSCH